VNASIWNGAVPGKIFSYAWRIPATGFAYCVLGLGGLFLAATVFPVIAWLSRAELPRARRIQAVIKTSFRAYVWMLQMLGIIRLQVSGAARLAACRDALIVANHPTLLDVVLLMSLVPNAQCVVKHQLWRNRFLGPVVRAAGYLRNDLEPQMLIERCRETLRAGSNLIIFPEGTRTVPGQPPRLQRGFANIALLVPVDLHVIRIGCDPVMLTKGLRWFDVPARRACFQVSLEERVATADFMSYGSRALGARRLTTYLETRFAAMQQ
jgi:1-acyl-sn-glycerol-3-phosphate acyltransferase